MKPGLFIAGIIVGGISVLVFVALGHDQALCSSGIGSFAQALDQQVATNCGKIQFWHDLSIVGAMAGAVLTAIGLLGGRKGDNR